MTTFALLTSVHYVYLGITERIKDSNENETSGRIQETPKKVNVRQILKSIAIYKIIEKIERNLDRYINH